MTIRLGDRVFLRACRAGEAGTVVRAERKRLVVFWPDMNYWSRHAPESLELAEGDAAGAARLPPPPSTKTLH